MDNINKPKFFRGVAYGGLIITSLSSGSLQCGGGISFWTLVIFLSMISTDLCLEYMERLSPVLKVWAWRYLVAMFGFGLFWNLVGTRLLISQLHHEYPCFTSINLFLLFIIQFAIYAIYLIVVRHCYLTWNHPDGLANRVKAKYYQLIALTDHNQGYREPLYEQADGQLADNRLSRNSNVPQVIAEAHPPLFIQNVKVCDICHGYFDAEKMLTTDYCRHTFHQKCLTERNIGLNECLYCKRPFPQLNTNYE
jgi:hypothetical protein